MIQTETQDAVVAMEHETQAVEAGSASALRTGDVFAEISDIAKRSSELAQNIASAASEQTSSTEKVGRAIKGVHGRRRGDAETNRLHPTHDRGYGQLAEGPNSSVAQFKLA